MLFQVLFSGFGIEYIAGTGGKDFMFEAITHAFVGRLKKVAVRAGLAFLSYGCVINVHFHCLHSSFVLIP
jgi:hypothetical protein